MLSEIGFSNNLKELDLILKNVQEKRREDEKLVQLYYESGMNNEEFIKLSGMSIDELEDKLISEMEQEEHIQQQTRMIFKIERTPEDVDKLIKQVENQQLLFKNKYKIHFNIKKEFGKITPLNELIFKNILPEPTINSFEEYCKNNHIQYEFILNDKQNLCLNIILDEKKYNIIGKNISQKNEEEINNIKYKCIFNLINNRLKTFI